MKAHLLSLLVTAAVATTASAQTVWNGSVNSNITEAGNWNPTNLPTSAGNTGTIGAGATVTIDTATLTSYFVIQNDGAVSRSAADLVSLNSGAYTINSGTLSVDRLCLGGTNQTFTIGGGTVSTATTSATGLAIGGTTTMSVNGGSFATRNTNIAANGTLNISGGTFTTSNNANASGIRLNGAGSSLLVSGGTVSLDTEIRSNSSMSFTGGTTTTTRLRAETGFSMTLGGTTAGSFTAGTVLGDAFYDINWLPGTQMTMTLSTVANWAETYWGDGRMTYDGKNFNDLGN